MFSKTNENNLTLRKAEHQFFMKLATGGFAFHKKKN